MKIRNKITKLLAVAASIAAMAVIGFSWTTGRTAAQTTIEQQAFAFNPVGIACGQTLRFSVFNPDALEQGSQPVRAQTWLYDSSGRLLAQTEAIAIAPGQFRSFDFKRDALSAEGESDSGRLQVRGVVQVVFSDGSVRPVRWDISGLPVSIEVIDNQSGKTVGGSYSTGYVKVSDD